MNFNTIRGATPAALGADRVERYDADLQLDRSVGREAADTSVGRFDRCYSRTRPLPGSTAPIT
jgi:hypothetical protein